MQMNACTILRYGHVMENTLIKIQKLISVKTSIQRVDTRVCVKGTYSPNTDRQCTHFHFFSTS